MGHRLKRRDERREGCRRDVAQMTYNSKKNARNGGPGPLTAEARYAGDPATRRTTFNAVGARSRQRVPDGQALAVNTPARP
jgi:hypothetical protein